MLIPDDNTTDLEFFLRIYSSWPLLKMYENYFMISEEQLSSQVVAGLKLMFSGNLRRVVLFFFNTAHAIPKPFTIILNY